MAIQKQKVILALIPFVLTTIIVLIFVFFFNYGTVTFIGESPFLVTINNTTHNDTNGKVNVTVPAAEQTFHIEKVGYFEQDFTYTIAWREQKEITLDFEFKPVETSGKFVPSITYTSSQRVQDNQNMIWLFTKPTAKSIELPGSYTRAVWAEDGKSACLFNPTESTVEPRLWQEGRALLSLPTNTFDCFATGKELISVQLNNQNLLFNTKLIKSNVQPNAFIAVNNDGTLAVLAEKTAEKVETQISIITLATNSISTLGEFTLIEQPRFIGNNTLALRNNGQILTFSPPFTTQQSPLTISLPLQSLVYNETTDTYYYLARKEPNGIPSLSDFINGSSSVGLSLISWNKNQERIITTFIPEKTFSVLTISTDGKNLAVFSPESNELLTYTIHP